jgi:hypothetical protein
MADCQIPFSTPIFFSIFGTLPTNHYLYLKPGKMTRPLPSLCASTSIVIGHTMVCNCRRVFEKGRSKKRNNNEQERDDRQKRAPKEGKSIRHENSQISLHLFLGPIPELESYTSTSLGLGLAGCFKILAKREESTPGYNFEQISRYITAYTGGQ